MTDRDNITLPREVVQEAVKALEFAERNHDGEQSLYTTEIAALRTALAAEPVKPITVPRTVPLPRITCGFVDVRFDGDGWFCDKCGERMSADFEASVKRGSSEKCYLELMQRKAEAVRTMNERNMK